MSSVPDLYELVLEHDDLAELDPAQRRLALRKLVAAEVSEDELGSCIAHLADAIDGFGPLSKMMRDPLVTDILVNGIEPVWVERGGSMVMTNVAFSRADELLALTDRLLSATGARADSSRPVAEARCVTVLGFTSYFRRLHPTVHWFRSESFLQPVSV